MILIHPTCDKCGSDLVFSVDQENEWYFFCSKCETLDKFSRFIAGLYLDDHSRMSLLK